MALREVVWTDLPQNRGKMPWIVAFCAFSRRSDFVREFGNDSAGRSMAASGGGSWALQRSDSGVCRMDIRLQAFERRTVRGVFGDPDVRIVRLDRRSKKRFAAVAGGQQTGWYDRRVRRVRDLSSAGFRIVLELEVRRVACRSCGTVKRERLDFLADNPLFTKRFAFYVGRRCRRHRSAMSPRSCKLDWDTVKTLEKQYMRAQLERAGTPAPRAIGIDEIVDPQGPQLSHRGQRPGSQAADLVRRRGSFRSQHGGSSTTGWG